MASCRILTELSKSSDPLNPPACWRASWARCISRDEVVEGCHQAARAGGFERRTSSVVARRVLLARRSLFPHLSLLALRARPKVHWLSAHGSSSTAIPKSTNRYPLGSSHSTSISCLADIISSLPIASLPGRGGLRRTTFR